MPNELNLTNKVEVLKVTIGEKTYSIPLATSLPYKKVKALIKLSKEKPEEQVDAFVEFFAQYIDREVLDELPMSSLTELAKAWSNANGDELGES